MTKKRYIISQHQQVSKVLEKKSDLVNRLVPRYLDRRLTGADFDEFVDTLLELLPKGIPRDTLIDSVRHLVNQKLTRHLIEENCWRLAGNIKRLKQTRPVPPWNKQRYPEWVPAQVVRVRLRRGGKRGAELGHEVTFKVLAGTSCPSLISQWWSRRKSRYLAHFKDEQGNGFGFVKAWPDKPTPYEYQDPHQLVTLRCLLLIDPEHCDAEGPGFHEIAHTGATTKWNKEQQKYRARQEEPYLCPKDMPADVLCHFCPIGLERCRAATHSKNYVQKKCSQCGEKAWHDPGDKVYDMCVSCVEDSILHPEDEED